jgi:23S rRNA (guanosine2251-2'-O)-methyltransferase
MRQGYSGRNESRRSARTTTTGGRATERSRSRSGPEARAGEDGRPQYGDRGRAAGTTEGGRPKFGGRGRTGVQASRPPRDRRGSPSERGPKATEDRRPIRAAAGGRPAPTDRSEVETVSYVAGRHPVLEALKAGRPINKILVSEASEGGSLLEILGKARAAGVVVQTVPKAHLTSIAGAGSNHQGIIAYVAPHDYADIDDVLARQTGQPPLVVLLDEISDPHNFGAVIRTAEATGVQGIVIPKRRAVPLTETVAKASAGAIEYVPVARVSNLVQAMQRFKEAGYWIVGTEVGAASAYTEVDYKGPIAVVIGAEGSGLSRLVKEHCDFLVTLPMLGKLQSLNASVAAGIILYEIVRQRS